jgi:hypothetical protein
MMLAAQRNLFTGSFNPLSLSPALWLSDTGSNPAQWYDLSGNGRHATQATGANQPAIVTGALNGRQVRRFDGSNDFMALTSGFDMLRNRAYGAIFAVCKTALGAVGTDGAVINISRGGSINQARLNIQAIPGGSIYRAGARRLDTDSFTGAQQGHNNNFNIVVSEALYSTGLLRIGLNGNYAQVSLPSSGNTSDTNSDAIELGRTGPFHINGDIAEILVFPTALSTENRRRIEGYLSSKYNIAIS